MKVSMKVEYACRVLAQLARFQGNKQLFHIEELANERGLSVDHSTIQRWVEYYSPQLEEVFRKNKKRTPNGSWRMDETYLKYIEPYLIKKQVLLFSHGYNIYYKRRCMVCLTWLVME